MNSKAKRILDDFSGSRTSSNPSANRSTSTSTSTRYTSPASPSKKKKKDDWQSILDDFAGTREPESTVSERIEARTTVGNNKKWYEGYFQKGAFGEGFSIDSVAKAILGTGSDLMEDITTGIVGIGETVVYAFAQIAPYVYQGNLAVNGVVTTPEQKKLHDDVVKEMKKENSEFIAKDLYDENKVAKQILSNVYGAANNAMKTQNGQQLTKEDIIQQKQSVNTAQKYLDESMEAQSVLGENSDSMAQSLGHRVASLALQSVGVPWWMTYGTTTFGSEAENAYKEGATYEQATGSAVTSAAAEIASEKLFGGSGLGEKGIINLDPLTRGISNKVVKTLLDYGIDIVAEGGEEVFTEVVSKLGTALYREENLSEILGSEEAFNDYIRAFISGGALSGIMNLGKAAGNAIEGTDYRDGLTQNEQKVVDLEYQRRLEKEGKLSAREKSELHAKVIQDMERGFISTDTIEEALGGEKYQNWKKARDWEDSLQEEYKELRSMKRGDMTGDQIDRETELRRLLDQVKAPGVDKTKSEIAYEVRELAKGDRLVESYNEYDRSFEGLQADFDKFKGAKYADAAKKTLENAINAGANNTNRVRDLVELAAKSAGDIGKVIHFKSQDDITSDFIERQTNEIAKLEAIPVDQMTDEQSDKLDALRDLLAKVESGDVVIDGDISDDGIVLNLDSQKPLNRVVGHEITHNFEKAKNYDSLKESLFNYAKAKGIDVEKEIKLKTLQYEGVTNADPEAELVADLVGDFLFTDTEYVNRLSVENRDVFQWLWDEVKHLYKMATAGSKEARELERVKKAFEDAYRAGAESQGTSYSLEYVGNTPYVKAEKTIFQKEDGSMATEKEVFDSLVGKTISFPDGDVEIVSRLPGKSMRRELVHRRPAKSLGVEDMNQLNADVNYNMEELLTNSTPKDVGIPDVGGKHAKQGITEFDTRKVNFYDGSKAYEIQFSIGILGDGKKVAYAKKYFKYNPKLTKKIQTAEARNKKSPLNQQSVSGDIVPEDGKKVNIQYSISENTDRVFYTPRGVEVVQNPTNAEYRQMREEIYKEYPWLRGTGEAILRHTYDEAGNEYYWNAFEGMHRDVEPYINKQYNTRTSQHWEWWTRVDKDDYPTDYSVRYSLSERNKDYAPTFYSHMGKVVDGVKQNKLGAASVVNMLRGKGVKAEEIKWSGIEEWLEDKKSVTKEELQEFVKGSMLQIEEQELTDSKKYSPKQQARMEELSSENESAWDEMFTIWEKLYPNYGFPSDIIFSDRPTGPVRQSLQSTGKYDTEDGKRMLRLAWIVEHNYLEAENISFEAEKPQTKWGDYKLAGGSNYRELLFKLPGRNYSNDAMDVHWGQKGVLAHARVQDFDTPNGKMLFIDEIQSDWHNEGHRIGYDGKEERARVDKLRKVADELYYEIEELSVELTGTAGEWEVVADTPKGAELLAKYDKAADEFEKAIYEDKVPDAPFRENYHEFVLKSLIRQAVEQGYDSIGWTTADIQSDRWSKAYAEGYRIEYDQDIPKFLNKYGKKWGAQVGKTYVNVPDPEIDFESLSDSDSELGDEWLWSDPDNDEEFNPFEELLTKPGTEVWTMPITESMKQSVLYEGQPFYAMSEDGAPVRNPSSSDIYGSDFRRKGEVAPIATNAVSNTENVLGNAEEEMFPDNISPVQDELDALYQEQAELENRMREMGDGADPDEATQVSNRYMDVLARVRELEGIDLDRVNSLGDENVPAEAEQNTPDVAPMKRVSPFDSRDFFHIYDRKIKSFVSENPEFAEIFKNEANIMLGELQRTEKGKRLYNDATYYDTRGEQGWMGQKRTTSESIAELIDAYGMRYEEIQKGLEAIIQGGDATNIAAAKKIEFMLDDRLKNGYTEFISDKPIPPNQEYLNLLDAWNASQVSQETAETLGDVDAPIEEVPETVAPTPVSPDPGDPVKPEVIPVHKAKKHVPDVDTKDQILPSQKRDKGKIFKAWEWAKEHIADNGMVFEDLSKKTGNRALEEKWDFIHRSAARAQHLIGRGDGDVKSLKAIRKEVKDSGKYKLFADYMYHKHNVDRMSLKSRNLGENKAVFGDKVTSEISARKCEAYEVNNPEFVGWAEEIYKFNRYLRNELVKGEVISQETADLWEKMYPHYVPIDREGFDGLHVNVPLDSNKTSVDNPVKRAKGGNQAMYDMFDTIGGRATQIYRAIARNQFGIELKNTLGRSLEHTYATLDEVLETLSSDEAILEAQGKYGELPTFTVFEDGGMTKFEITQEMYEALKPKSAAMQYRAPLISGWSEMFRKLTTEYNPAFMLTNPIKDVQDILLNSQHPLKTYGNLIPSIWQQMFNGKYYQEYLKNGGESNSYYDYRSSTFNDSKLDRFNVVSWMNNHIEMTPRLAEYIASRKDGKSVEGAMLDAARVTTNFSAGGDVTKFFNANGVPFLNASVQGAVQQVRNVREAHHRGWMGYAGLLTRYAVAGLPAVLLNGIWDDDEDYQELADYVKENYYIVKKTEDGRFIRIPKGRAVAVIQDAVEKTLEVATGDNEMDMATFLDMAADHLKLAAENLGPNNPFDNNVLAPLIQIANNRTWYDEEIVPSRLQDLPAAEQFDEKTDSMSIKIGQATNTSPKKWNYLFNQISGGVGDILLPMGTPKAESGDDSMMGNFLAPIRDKFTTDAVLNNQVVTDFRDIQDELTVKANGKDATDEDKLMSEYIDTISFELNDLYAQKREIQMSNKPNSVKYEQTRELQRQINEAMEDALSQYKNVHVDGAYSEVGDRRFNYDSNKGTWYQIKEKNADGSDNYYYQNEQKALEAFDCSPADYWNNRDAYDDALYYATSYGKNLVTTAKNVFGVDGFAKYGKDLSYIKADYDKKGNSISGSRKKKVISYINETDADYGERIILFKSQYPADDRYDRKIVEYLNTRDDIEYQDKLTILKELGFEINSKGKIVWD